ncbi:MAG: four helix bundle protein [Anaerolineae bacterium]|nr:four helix bundle protein [Anaerolineae bacterium]
MNPNSDIHLAHEKLDVYQNALQFYALASNILDALPQGKQNAIIVDQLSRAALSIMLNIAEGTGKPNGSDDAKRFYNIARGSAMECGACLDALFIRKKTNETLFIDGKRLLIRIVSMLSKM